MKLAFPNGEREDFAVGKGSFSIGGDNDDDIVIGAASRAILTIDQRGITLSMDEPANDAVLVNSRPVRSKAILRLGDRIRIGSVDMVLRSEDVDFRTPPHPFEALAEDLMLARIHLRGITGQHAGEVFPIREAITIGGDDADIVIAPEFDLRLQVGMKDDHVYVLRESGGGVLDVNGHMVKHAEVRPGDQIAFGEERFLVEAPGFVPGDVYSGEAAAESSGNTQVFSAAAFNAHREAQNQSAAESARNKAPEPQAAGDRTARTRDGIIIGVCVLLSVAMVVFLMMQL